jgi:VWFA-related protein
MSVASPSTPSPQARKYSRYHHTFALARLLLSLFLLAAPSFTHAQSTTPPLHSAHPLIIKMNVDLVDLHATVVDKKGRLVSGLVQNDFQIYEDYVPQQINFFSHEDVPVTVGLVIDNSGSMKPKVADVITAALAFANSSNPDDQIFEVNFNEHVSFGLPEKMPFTSQPIQLGLALSTIQADGQTALYDAIAAALDHLKLGSRDKKVLIIVSDGGDNASKLHLAQILTLAEQSEVIIYTIGIFDDNDADRNPDVLRQLAKKTGGEAYFPPTFADITPACVRIAHDIRSQYTLAYLPTNTAVDGSYRTIQVKAADPSLGPLSVRTRTGYIVPLASSPTSSPAPQSASKPSR